ncbi:hypothetical protein HDU87_007787 [Geranomyces variabilis]|uniref:Uncharacterized protein n=1 Tax=Geranomyces variabilis TaxID=109894 RepID=A0AAD5TG00_9FUNG|nr:hypothetical protein HDU87_007787 [Geranomyces variabilis]
MRPHKRKAKKRDFSEESPPPPCSLLPATTPIQQTAIAALLPTPPSSRSDVVHCSAAVTSDYKPCCPPESQRSVFASSDKKFTGHNDLGQKGTLDQHNQPEQQFPLDQQIVDLTLTDSDNDNLEAALQLSSAAVDSAYEQRCPPQRKPGRLSQRSVFASASSDKKFTGHNDFGQQRTLDQHHLDQQVIDLTLTDSDNEDDDINTLQENGNVFTFESAQQYDSDPQFKTNLKAALRLSETTHIAEQQQALYDEEIAMEIALSNSRKTLLDDLGHHVATQDAAFKKDEKLATGSRGDGELVTSNSDVPQAASSRATTPAKPYRTVAWPTPPTPARKRQKTQSSKSKLEDVSSAGSFANSKIRSISPSLASPLLKRRKQSFSPPSLASPLLKRREQSFSPPSLASPLLKRREQSFSPSPRPLKKPDIDNDRNHSIGSRSLRRRTGKPVYCTNPEEIDTEDNDLSDVSDPSFAASANRLSLPSSSASETANDDSDTPVTRPWWEKGKGRAGPSPSASDMTIDERSAYGDLDISDTDSESTDLDNDISDDTDFEPTADEIAAVEKELKEEADAEAEDAKEALRCDEEDYMLESTLNDIFGMELGPETALHDDDNTLNLVEDLEYQLSGDVLAGIATVTTAFTGKKRITEAWIKQHPQWTLEKIEDVHTVVHSVSDRELTIEFVINEMQKHGLEVPGRLRRLSNKTKEALATVADARTCWMKNHAPQLEIFTVICAILPMQLVNRFSMQLTELTYQRQLILTIHGWSERSPQSDHPDRCLALNLIHPIHDQVHGLDHILRNRNRGLRSRNRSLRNRSLHNRNLRNRNLRHPSPNHQANHHAPPARGRL